MATELVSNTNGNSSDKDTLYMLEGVALVVLGAGLILSIPLSAAICRKSESASWPTLRFPTSNAI